MAQAQPSTAPVFPLDPQSITSTCPGDFHGPVGQYHIKYRWPALFYITCTSAQDSVDSRGGSYRLNLHSTQFHLPFSYTDCKYLDSEPVYRPFRPHASYVTIMHQCFSNNIDASYLLSPRPFLAFICIPCKIIDISHMSYLYQPFNVSHDINIHVSHQQPWHQQIPIFPYPIDHNQYFHISHIYIIAHCSTQYTHIRFHSQNRSELVPLVLLLSLSTASFTYAHIYPNTLNARNMIAIHVCNAREMQDYYSFLMLNISSQSFQNLVNSCYNIKHNFSLSRIREFESSNF